MFELLKQLQETLDNPLQFKQVYTSASLTKYAFIFGDDLFNVDFNIDDLGGITLVTISFFLHLENETANYQLVSKNTNALPVISTVNSIVKQFIASHHYDYITFTAIKEGSRVGVYNYMIQKMVPSKEYYCIAGNHEKNIYVVSKQPMSNELKQEIIKHSEQHWDSK